MCSSVLNDCTLVELIGTSQQVGLCFVCLYIRASEGSCKNDLASDMSRFIIGVDTLFIVAVDKSLRNVACEAAKYMNGKSGRVPCLMALAQPLHE